MMPSWDILKDPPAPTLKTMTIPCCDSCPSLELDGLGPSVVEVEEGVVDDVLLCNALSRLG